MFAGFDVVLADVFDADADVAVATVAIVDFGNSDYVIGD